MSWIPFGEILDSAPAGSEDFLGLLAKNGTLTKYHLLQEELKTRKLGRISPSQPRKTGSGATQGKAYPTQYPIFCFFSVRPAVSECTLLLSSIR